ncbi:MAG: phosphoribosylpyrophosphate synthetase [Phaeodactylibacter sp.]|nr:phosphoribosylpyrophosphate synthetase [Phaeodactylibacter sp.]MCB9264548.1 phosphoribosylpyrophosphate synthetase [Lewinellaceae bacterium]MCB9287346.1 phosphoribosylpyrophosphate synthetase [Lewinellaceae bacterium]
MRNFENLVEAINALKKEGYTYDFNLLNDCIHCQELDKGFRPETFEVEEVLHFEGADSSPETRSILYVISTSAGEKGMLLEADSIYNSDLSEELIQKLKIQRP